MELLLGINNFMGYTELSKMKTKALYVTSPDAVTRTSLIVAYYYYYNAVHEDDGDDKWKNFAEVFKSFQAGIDPKLQEAHYQPLSGKNIFDVLVTFSSYAYLNM